MLFQSLVIQDGVARKSVFEPLQRHFDGPRFGLEKPQNPPGLGRVIATQILVDDLAKRMLKKQGPNTLTQPLNLLEVGPQCLGVQDDRGRFGPPATDLLLRRALAEVRHAFDFSRAPVVPETSCSSQPMREVAHEQVPPVQMNDPQSRHRLQPVPNVAPSRVLPNARERPQAPGVIGVQDESYVPDLLRKSLMIDVVAQKRRRGRRQRVGKGPAIRVEKLTLADDVRVRLKSAPQHMGSGPEVRDQNKALKFREHFHYIYYKPFAYVNVNPLDPTPLHPRGWFDRYGAVIAPQISRL